MIKKPNLTQMVTKCLGMEVESLPLLPILELCCDRRVLVENHGGVTEYSPERIQIVVRFGRVILTGRDLSICKMGQYQLVIRGRIDQIAIERGQ